MKIKIVRGAYCSLFLLLRRLFFFQCRARQGAKILENSKKSSFVQDPNNYRPIKKKKAFCVYCNEDLKNIS
ncbi:hypothetical protein BpHYR1_016173 [Brachionus plicatilis]|uniref:Uncharacterized protein n=1 Tax=Brachionus plicatilis TaxID=10195 RepID=A0A3M7PG92_BRAPC|nr:hypothetical protein BpHYR1_016173 [Brachionus plicatilis]